MTTDLIEYGSKLDAMVLAETLAFLFESNLKNEQRTNERPTPICIWGTHGLGKTRERDCPWNIPSLSKRFGKGPEEAQQLFLRAAQHGKVVQRW